MYSADEAAHAACDARPIYISARRFACVAEVLVQLSSRQSRYSLLSASSNEHDLPLVKLSIF